jgi:ABC-2 type transport system ATP-binding protein
MLIFTNLRKTFGPVVAVDDLTFEISRGEVFGLLGPNGAGKTTTVNLATGALRPDRGKVELEGYGATDGAAVRAKIGMAPQTLSLYDDLSGEENLAFFGKIYGLRGSNLRERVEWALDFAGLTERGGDKAKVYSGGMKRRLNLAIALIHDPPMLLLDEPTVGVDPQSRNAIFEKIQMMSDSGKTIVYTTHYMEEAQRLCDRVGIIDNGKLLALDSVDGLISEWGGKSVILAEREDGEIRVETDDPMRELAELQDGGRLTRFTVDRPDLESVFLNLTGRHLRDI